MKLITLIISFIISQQLFSQDETNYYEIAGELASEGQYEKAIENYNKELKREPGNYYALYNRGLCHSYLGETKKSIDDFSEVIFLNPDSYKAYLNRALSKRVLTDYEGALYDVERSLEIEEDYAEGYFHRGVLKEYLKNQEQACKDLNKARELGLENLDEMIETACDADRDSNYANILYLTQASTDKTYGLKGDNPVKVGMGLRGGPSNQRAYLNLLRDEQGKPIKYERKRSCCGYNSENAIYGVALVDVYEITYLNKKGKAKKTELYISFYDYEEPQIPVGFSTVAQE